MRAAFLLAAITFATSASAADVNAYRTGQAYMATPAPSAMVCEMQCSGDAQCRSWNFLPARIPGAAGQCQLNATAGQAMGHPFAISGAAAGAPQSYDSRVIAAGTRTTRIGQPAAAAPAPQPRIIRQAVRRPMPVQQRPLMRPAPQAAPQLQRAAAPRIQTPRPVVRHRQLAPRPAPQAPAQITPQAPATAPTASLSLTEQQNLQRRAQSTQRSPQTPTAAARAIPAPAPRPIQASAPQYQPAPQTRPLTRQRPVPAPIPAGGFAPLPIQDQANAPAMDRLYGSLYDDAGPKQMKMPLYSERPADDLDAPVVTTIPAPTTPVMVDSLPMAGGPL